ncbi:hypothetical protein BHE90_003653 [Fusarium euwallaceae]|uniref:Rhodopsin domain-containing protein n=2 Tax=Fusarium solani species complex TaxID=232080 RepID=A0A3M2RYH5_9HYPO|nr:hypothetical protein CDV36_010016 [Fusarium kuroshium]RTE81798.1 hypothetical protein BHE90_003653 [Fusarium euwallaceae]
MTGLVPNVYAAIIIPMPAAALALVLRIKARRMTRMGLGYDDALCIAAWVFAVGYSVDLIVWAACFKLGQKLAPYSDEKIDYYMEKSRMMLWASEYLYAWSIALTKLAVLSFYRRLFQFSSIRIPIIVLMVMCGIWLTLRTFLTTFHCLPVPAYWDKTITNARCITHVARFYLGTDLTHCLMDFIILALPIWEIIRMRLPFGQKIAVLGLFALGSLVGIASIFQIIQSQTYNPSTRELPYEFALAMVWGSVEVHLAVFTSCLALLRPIFRKVIPGLSSGNSYAASRPSVAFQPPSEFAQAARSPRDDLLDSERGSTRQEYDTLSLPGSKDNSSSGRGIFHHREYRMSSLQGSQGSDSRLSEGSVR